MRFQQFLVGMGQPNLSYGSGGLTFLQPQRPVGEIQVATPQRNGARRYQNDLLTPAPQSQQVFDQRFQPGAIEPPGACIHQQCGAHLDDHAPRRRQRVA